MVESDKDELNTSTFWFIIVPICVFILLGFFLYVLFNVNSIQTASTKRVFEIIKNMKHIR